MPVTIPDGSEGASDAHPGTALVALLLPLCSPGGGRSWSFAIPAGPDRGVLWRESMCLP